MFISGEQRRDRIVQFVGNYWLAHAYGPSMREIAEGVGLAAWSSAAYQVAVLVAEGRLDRAPTIPRSIRVVE